MSRTILLIVLSVVPCLGGGTVGPPRLTEGQATAAAQAFCTRIGRPVSGAGSARFPGSRAIYWQPTWNVTFREDQTTVEVVDATGTIAFYAHGLGRVTRSAPDRPPISEAEARKIAEAAIAATGDPASLAYDSAQITRPGGRPDRVLDQWLITYGRRCGTVPYMGQAARVSMNPYTGVIFGLSCSFPTAPVSDAAAVVGREQAQAAARQVLAAHGKPTAFSPTVTYQIVRPNGVWAADKQPPKGLPPAVPAWVFSAADGLRTHDVWVNAKTGEVCGGMISEPAGALADVRLPARK